MLVGARLRLPGHPAEKQDDGSERNFLGENLPTPAPLYENIPREHNDGKQQDGLFGCAGHQETKDSGAIPQDWSVPAESHDVAVHGQDGEGRRHEIFAAGNPRDDFDMGWMKEEERRSSEGGKYLATNRECEQVNA